jgi:hypothetical protein
MDPERISYDEAKAWFWIRTWLWFAICALLSVMAFFGYGGGMLKTFPVRFWVSVVAGISVTLLGLSGAYLSLQFPWMRLGWRFGFALNGPASAAISALAGFFLCGAVLSLMQNDPVHPPSPAVIQVTYSLMKFGVAAAGLWGFIFGSWFAMRRDKYFVEPI